MKDKMTRMDIILGHSFGMLLGFAQSCTETGADQSQEARFTSETRRELLKITRGYSPALPRRYCIRRYSWQADIILGTD
jgi:hypothetical protein